MKIKDPENLIKLFGITNQFTELDLDRIEAKYQINLGRKKDQSREGQYLLSSI